MHCDNFFEREESEVETHTRSTTPNLSFPEEALFTLNPLGCIGVSQAENGKGYFNSMYQN